MWKKGARALRILLCALNASYSHTCLSLRYLAALRASASHQVEFLEYTINDPLDQIEAEIERRSPELLAFSCYIWNITLLLDLADSLKKVRPGLTVLLGGPEVSFAAEEFLAQNLQVDMVAAGEGELVWPILLAALAAGGGLEQVPGLSWRENGTIRVNPAPPPLSLADLPRAYRPETENYAKRLIYYEASRGCPFTCAFCLSGEEQGVRFADPARVLRDMETLAASGAAAIKFVDRTFNCHREHALAIWRGLLPYAGKMRFHFELAGDLLTHEELDFLAAVPPGLFQFEVGVQSTHEPTLEAISRPTDLGRLEANLRALLAPGNIHIHLDLIVGLPFESYERFLDSLDFCLRLFPDALQVGFLKMLKGTRLRREADALGYLYRRRPPYEVLANPWLSFPELNRLKVLAGLADRYYSRGRFLHTLRRVFADTDSPARFLAGLAAYTADTGWYLRRHQTRDLPPHLLAYLESRGAVAPWLRDCLRLDLLCTDRHEPEPAWADPPEVPGLQNIWHDWLRPAEHRAELASDFADLTPREVAGRTRIIVLPTDPRKDAPVSSGLVFLALIYPGEGSGAEKTRVVRLESFT